MDTKSVHIVYKDKEVLLHDKTVTLIRRNVKILLKQRNMTLKEFSRQSKLTYTTLHRSLYQSETITLMTLSRVAIGFGLEIAELLKPICENKN